MPAEAQRGSRGRLGLSGAAVRRGELGSHALRYGALRGRLDAVEVAVTAEAVNGHVERLLRRLVAGSLGRRTGAARCHISSCSAFQISFLPSVPSDALCILLHTKIVRPIHRSSQTPQGVD